MLNKGCRWESLVAKVLQPVEVIWYHGEPDWQGSAEVLVLRADNTFVTYGWSWGSCSGCDSWEGEPEEDVRAEIAHNMQVMDADTAVGYLQGLIKNNNPDNYGSCDPQALQTAKDRTIELAYKEMDANRAKDRVWVDFNKAITENVD